MATTSVNNKSSSQSSLPSFVEREQLLPPSGNDALTKVRFIDRNTGRISVNRSGAKEIVTSYIKTGYHTLIDTNWVLFMISLVIFYLISFAFFGLLYYFLAGNGCIEHVETWSEAFFFSVQTGMTIGYGSMYPDGCRLIIYAVTIQSIYGLISDALVLGLAFEKLSRPEPARNAILFSNKAVICKRDGKINLIIRVAWIKPIQLIEAHVRLYISDNRITSEGEVIHRFVELDLNETTSSFIYLALPHDIVHEINEDSPLYQVRREHFYQKDIELVVVVEGISALTSDTIQSHYSYMSSDIAWNKYFPCIVSRNPDRSYTIDYSKFNDLEDKNYECIN